MNQTFVCRLHQDELEVITDSWERLRFLFLYISVYHRSGVAVVAEASHLFVLVYHFFAGFTRMSSRPSPIRGSATAGWSSLT